MAVQKNFVVKNGIEVNENLIFADKNQNTVGIGTTITPQKLRVNGGIGATSLVLTGVGTIPTLQSTNGTITTLSSNSGSITTVTGSTLNYNNGYIVSGVVTSLSGSTLNYTGISSVGSLSIGSTQVISSGRQLQNIASLDSTTTATIEAAIANAPNTFTNLVVTGVSTLGVTGITTLNVTGISTLGTVQVSSGIITATSGIVTYYGDGTNLTLAGNPDLVFATGIGIGTTGGLVGYGITFLDLKGAGVSTSQYNSSVGIATIFFEGGGGGGAIGIGSTFPGTPLSVELPPSNGDLFFHIDYGRTFIYYDEVVLGVGSSAFWIDSSPFNIGIITALSGGVAFSDGSAGSPSWYFEDDVTTGVFSPVNGELTFVSTGSSVLNINSSGVVVTGVVTATSFVGDGSGITGISSVSFATTSFGLSGTPNLNVGVVTATSFVGNLTGTASTATASGTAYGLSGTPNLNVGVVTATSFVGNLTGTASTAGYATTSFGLEGSPAIQVSSASVNTSETPTKLYVSGNAASNIVGLGTTNANTTLDFSTGNNFSLELVGSIVLSNPTGVTTGQSGIILIQQDGSGSRTCGFGSHWDFPSATPPTLSTGANALDALTYFVRSSTSIVTNSLIGIGTL